jgi:hypothetical protein
VLQILQGKIARPRPVRVAASLTCYILFSNFRPELVSRHCFPYSSISG